MIKFFKNIYKKIMQLDSYTTKYLQNINNVELPFLAYTNWGLHYADFKDYNSAIEKLETAMLMFGKNPKPCISLGIIYAKLKEYDKSIKVLQEAIKRDSQNSYAYSVLSSVYVAIDKFNEAEDALEKALKLSPNDYEIYLNYGIFYAKTQKNDKAIEMFKKSKFYNSSNMHTNFLLGVMYFETNSIDEALQEFEYILGLNPKYKKLSYYLALCYQKKENYDLVVDYAKNALEEEPDNPSIYILLAHAYLYLKDEQKALYIYRLGHEHNINDFDFFLSESVVQSNCNNTEQAMIAIEKALTLKPDDANALYRMGLYKKQQNNLDDAIKYFNKSIESNPNNTQSISALGTIKYENGDYSDAIQLFFKAINIEKNNNYLYFNIANSYYLLGRYKKSIEYYEKMFEYYPENLDAYINCTICLLTMGNYKEGLRKIRNAYQINRTDERVILIYALADLKCGIYSDAKEKVNIVLSSDPNNIYAKLIKIQILINLKEPNEAVEILNTIDENRKNEEIFTFLLYSAYKILVEENPSQYNESMLNLYAEKLNNADIDFLNKNGIISYITKK